MKQFRLPIFTSKIKIYNLRIVPPDFVFNEVLELKEQFESLFGKQPLSRSKPHITLATFKMNSKHQDLLIGVFNRLSQREAFKINIDGFGIFEGSKTLYLNIALNEAIEAIHRDVRLLHDDQLKRTLKSFSVTDNPHIIISKTTGQQMLDESLQHFEKNNYSKQIEVRHLTLASRSKYKTWDWEHHIKLSEDDSARQHN